MFVCGCWSAKLICWSEGGDRSITLKQVSFHMYIYFHNVLLKVLQKLKIPKTCMWTNSYRLGRTAPWLLAFLGENEFEFLTRRNLLSKQQQLACHLLTSVAVGYITVLKTEICPFSARALKERELELAMIILCQRWMRTGQELLLSLSPGKIITTDSDITYMADRALKTKYPFTYRVFTKNTRQVSEKIWCG